MHVKNAVTAGDAGILIAACQYQCNVYRLLAGITGIIIVPAIKKL